MYKLLYHFGYKFYTPYLFYTLSGINFPCKIKTFKNNLLKCEKYLLIIETLFLYLHIISSQNKIKRYEKTRND